MGRVYDALKRAAESGGAKVKRNDDAATRVEEAFHLTVRHEAWDHAFSLVSRFAATHLLDALIEASNETRQLIVTDITTNVDKIASLLASRRSPLQRVARRLLLPCYRGPVEGVGAEFGQARRARDHSRFSQWAKTDLNCQPTD